MPWSSELLKYLLLILMSYRGKVKELQRFKNDPVLKKIYFFAKQSGSTYPAIVLISLYELNRDYLCRQLSSFLNVSQFIFSKICIVYAHVTVRLLACRRVFASNLDIYNLLVCRNIMVFYLSVSPPLELECQHIMQLCRHACMHM